MTDQELIMKAVESYTETQSFKRTAASLHISTGKVRKALLTAGVWTNDTAEKIQKAREEHSDWGDVEIANHLHISIKAVQMYTPYKLGPYDPNNRSASATRTAEYRSRNQAKSDTPDVNRREMASMMKKEEDPFDRPLNDLTWYEEEKKKAEEHGLPFPQFRHNPDPEAKPHVDDQFFLDYRLVEPAHYQDRHPTLQACHIRLEVDTDNMSAEELDRINSGYGVKKAWSRDLIIPSYIPLHYLHYVIQRAFAFENRGDHLFQFTEEDFSAALEAAGGDEDLRTYCRLCGILFRFPEGNDEELYWDDDYDGSKSIRTWLKEKYEGSWDTDAGTGYEYADNQYRIWNWLGDKVEDFHKYAPARDEAYDDFYEKLKEMGAPDHYTIGEMDGESIPETGQFPFNNVLECLSLEDLMTLEREPYLSFEDDLETAESELLDNLVTLEEARAMMKKAEELYNILSKRMKSGKWDEDVLLVKRWRETAKKAAQLYMLSRGGAEAVPFVGELVYLYDFGRRKGLPMEGEAKWKIRIKLVEEYYDNSVYYSRNYTPSDATGARFQNDPEKEAEYADRLQAMCHWKEKLEVINSEDRRIRPEDEKEMMIKLRPEQELLPEERERIEKDRKLIEESRIEHGWEKEREVVIDDRLYKALKIAMLEHRPVCIGREGSEPGEGYPDEKARGSSIENLV